MSRFLKVAVTAGVCLGLASCQTARNLWPFGGGDDGPRAVASRGERVSVLEFDETVQASAALAGQSFMLPPAAPATAWPLPGGTPEQSIEHVHAGESFQVAWRRSVGEGSARAAQVMAPLVAADGRIYAMDGHARVTAFDAASGAQLWSANLRPSGRDRSAFGGGLAVAGGRLYATSGFRTVAALDAATGAVAWTRDVEAPIHGAPTVAGGRVYAVDVDNQIIAFDADDGQQSWSYQAIVEPARLLRASSPAVTGETVVAPFSSGELVALRSSNGQVLWQQVLSRTNRTNALSEIRDIAGRPIISRGVVYAASHSGVFAAVDVRTGARRWELPVASVTSPWAAGDVVFVTSNAGQLVAVNRESGGVYWIRDLNEGRARQEGGFLGIGDRTVRPIWAGPMLASNRLVLVNSDGEAVALDPRTGNQVAQLGLGGPAYISPIAYNGMIYVLTDEGQLVAIR